MSLCALGRRRSQRCSALLRCSTRMKTPQRRSRRVRFTRATNWLRSTETRRRSPSSRPRNTSGRTWSRRSRPKLHVFETSADPSGFRSWLFDPASESDYCGHLAEQSPDTKWNDPTYRMLKLDSTSGGWRLTCGTGWYFESLATSEVLDAEMMRALAPAPDRSVDLEVLPRRRWVHRHVEGQDLVLDGAGRSGALSVATVTMYRAPGQHGPGRYEVILSPRADWVARHRFYNHVAPSGIFQTLLLIHVIER